MKPNRYADSVDFDFCRLDTQIDEIMELTEGGISEEHAAAIVHWSEDRVDLPRVAADFGRVLVWLSEGNSTVEIGQKCLACLYVLRPDLIGGATLEQIGRQSSVTRAAIDKHVNEFRDTFGVMGFNNRSENTRSRCHKAQLNRKK